MYRIRPLAQFRKTNNLLVCGGDLEVYNIGSGTWSLPTTPSNTRLLLQWLIGGNSPTIPETISQAQIACTPTILNTIYSPPHHITLDLTGLDFLLLPHCYFAYCSNEVTKVAVEPANVKIVSEGLQIDVNGLTGRHDFFLVPKMFEPVTITEAMIEDDTVVLPMGADVYGIADELGNVTKSYTDVGYLNGNTRIHFPTTNITAGHKVIIDDIYRINVNVAPADTKLRFQIESPFKTPNADGNMIISPVSIRHGYTEVPITGNGFMVFYIPCWFPVNIGLFVHHVTQNPGGTTPGGNNPWFTKEEVLLLLATYQNRELIDEITGDRYYLVISNGNLVHRPVTI